MDKYQLSERNICIKFIMPTILQADGQQHQLREEVPLSDRRVIVRGKLTSRIKNPKVNGCSKRANFVLYSLPNVPIAVVNGEYARFPVSHGLTYAEMLDAPYVISRNGERAHVVLDVLLDKFAVHGVQNIENAKVLERPSFDQFSSKAHIGRGIFGGMAQ